MAPQPCEYGQNHVLSHGDPRGSDNLRGRTVRSQLCLSINSFDFLNALIPICQKGYPHHSAVSAVSLEPVCTGGHLVASLGFSEKTQNMHTKARESPRFICVGPMKLLPITSTAGVSPALPLNHGLASIFSINALQRRSIALTSSSRRCFISK